MHNVSCAICGSSVVTAVTMTDAVTVSGRDAALRPLALGRAVACCAGTRLPLLARVRVRTRTAARRAFQVSTDILNLVPGYGRTRHSSHDTKFSTRIYYVLNLVQSESSHTY